MWSTNETCRFNKLDVEQQFEILTINNNVETVRFIISNHTRDS